MRSVTLMWWSRPRKEPSNDVAARLERAVESQRQATEELRELLNNVKEGQISSGLPDSHQQ